GLLTHAHGTKEYFSDLGLYNYGRRFYDPKSGRFIGRDPIQENGGLNLYAFVRNNPANLWDYLGMIEDGMCWSQSSLLAVPCGSTLDTGMTMDPVFVTSPGGRYFEKGGWDNAVKLELFVVEAPMWRPPSVEINFDGVLSPPRNNAGSTFPGYMGGGGVPQNKRAKEAPLDLMKKLCGTEAGRALVEALQNGSRTVREVASDQLSSNLQAATAMTAGTSNEATGVIYLFPGNYSNLANTLANSRFNYGGSTVDFGASTLIHETLHFNNPAPPGPVPAGQTGRFEEALVRQLTDRALPSYNLPQIFGLPDRFQNYLGTVPNHGTNLATGKATNDYGQKATSSIMSQLDAASSELNGWDCSRVK
ncbi:MAG: RHS repeat-associated core domain-containing protein, partial [Opitutaceae bacterium]|nr:RHS repeat-associated core domain-containing protein [Opitutaceae bacterium]